MAKNDILVFLPTYNEAGHVTEMRDRIKATGVAADIMFLDDNSTDGTGEIIDRFAAEDETMFAVHRPGKEGIGGAHLDGIRRAYEAGYKILITMDSDLVHKPEDIPAFLAAGEAAEPGAAAAGVGPAGGAVARARHSWLWVLVVLVVLLLGWWLLS